MAVKIAKNRKLDVAYIQLRNGKVNKTIEMKPGVLMDIDNKGNLLGIEILSMSSLAPVLRSIPRKTSTKRKAA